MALNIVHLPPEATIKVLEDDTLDFALSMGLRHGKTIRSAVLFDDRMCCVMRADHPLAATNLTMARFLKSEHMRVAMSPTDIRFVDNVIADRGLRRRVALTVPHWLLVPRTLLDTDLLAVVSRKLAEQFTGDGRIVVKSLPFDSESFAWQLYWHRRYDRSPAHVWIREAVIAVCADL